jgi:hypothetical protein
MARPRHLLRPMPNLDATTGPPAAACNEDRACAVLASWRSSAASPTAPRPPRPAEASSSAAPSAAGKRARLGRTGLPVAMEQERTLSRSVADA